MNGVMKEGDERPDEGQWRVTSGQGGLEWRVTSGQAREGWIGGES